MSIFLTALICFSIFATVFISIATEWYLIYKDIYKDKSFDDFWSTQESFEE